jgi:hypothetical protein
MPQRFNWTERKRIGRTDASISLVKSTPLPSFDATIKVGDYDLPLDARVVVEAYRQTTWRRFGFGTVALVRAESACTLEAFGLTDGVRFRLKVLAPASEDGRILAEADRIRVTDPLLPVQGDDLGEEIYRLSFAGSGDAPILVLNNRLVDWRQTARTAQFRALAYPMLLRQILTVAYSAFDPDEKSWQGDWIDFAAKLPGVQEAPDREASDIERENWVEDVISAFCRSQRFLTRYSTLLTEGGSN